MSNKSIPPVLKITKSLAALNFLKKDRMNYKAELLGEKTKKEPKKRKASSSSEEAEPTVFDQYKVAYGSLKRWMEMKDNELILEG